MIQRRLIHPVPVQLCRRDAAQAQPETLHVLAQVRFVQYQQRETWQEAPVQHDAGELIVEMESVKAVWKRGGLVGFQVVALGDDNCVDKQWCIHSATPVCYTSGTPAFIKALFGATLPVVPKGFQENEHPHGLQQDIKHLQ